MLFSALCGATPDGSAGQTWIIACRILLRFESDGDGFDSLS